MPKKVPFEIRYGASLRYAGAHGFLPIAPEYGTVYRVQCATCGHILGRSSYAAIFRHAFRKHGIL